MPGVLRGCMSGQKLRGCTNGQTDRPGCTQGQAAREAIGVERGYVNLREPMLKQIGAIPGDTVVLEDGFLSVNGEATEMTIATHDSFGGDLYAYPTPITLQLGQYWLISDPERGFDSRYFGPVNGNAFTHRAYPVF